MPFVSIQLVGFSPKAVDGAVTAYGHRKDDVACRVVGFALKEKDAFELLTEARISQTLPEVEIDNRFWFYVAVVPKDTMWEKGKEPS